MKPEPYPYPVEAALSLSKSFEKRILSNGRLTKQLPPDPDWLLFVAGDARSETNHIYPLDVSDLTETEGVGRELLSPEGKNDLTRTNS
jgi:hypothetical protein